LATTASILPGVLGQVFTSSGTFTIPTGVTALKATVIGGGGGAGGVACGWYSSGACGASAIVYLSGLTSGNTIAVTIGALGAGNSSGNGGNGGTSRIASGTQTITTCQSTGGTGGIQPSASVPGTATGGSININLATGAALGPGGATTTLLSPTPNAGYGYGGYGGGQSGGAGIVVFEW
jgi:hypothetical protein